ncbi:hypothetical protein DFP72DRAFT_996777 [Ephemerocybe angulata]|uniref:Uncharacterized protein n=1 Tax=Ephemerocybe angulata TaxID=980116 RepID=A0A8H6II15_9AGAR|nr:hypothetical protein DFP72DRAFT_996777 [Tulosesus angulatus]
MAARTSTLTSSSPPGYPGGSLEFPPSLDSRTTVTDDWSRLTRCYPNAITDFYGTGIPCIFKTGPEWPVARGPDAQKIVRTARPIHNHKIQPIWVETVIKIGVELDMLKVKWNALDPLAYANAGQSALICDFAVTVSVQPRSLAYDKAVVAAKAVQKILSDAGFPEIEVACIESLYHPSGSAPKLRGLTPEFMKKDISDLQKPFTLALGLSIAPFKLPSCEGTGGLFMRLSRDENDDRVALLTCAHVSFPPPHQSANKAYTFEQGSHSREDIILLGEESFQTNVDAIKTFIGRQTTDIEAWTVPLGRIPEPTQDEAKEITEKRDEYHHLIETARANIVKAEVLHSTVTKDFTLASSRVFGHVLHSAKIEVGEDRYMRDWSLIQLDRDRIDWNTFNGNKLFVGGNKSVGEWTDYMFPQNPDRDGSHIPEHMLLPLKDHVPKTEFLNPPNHDIHNKQTLLAVKNGRTTGTTFGRVNGLESLTREYNDYNIAEMALEVVVAGYDTVRGQTDKFSDRGDSGSIFVGRDGRMIGLLTGGGGPTERVDRTYITPFYALMETIHKKFPGCHPLSADSA